MKKLITLAAALSLALVCFAQTPTQYQPPASSLLSDKTAGLFENQFDKQFSANPDFGSYDQQFLYGGLGNPRKEGAMLNGNVAGIKNIMLGYYRPAAKPWSIFGHWGADGKFDAHTGSWEQTSEVLGKTIKTKYTPLGMFLFKKYETHLQFLTGLGGEKNFVVGGQFFLNSDFSILHPERDFYKSETTIDSDKTTLETWNIQYTAAPFSLGNPAASTHTFEIGIPISMKMGNMENTTRFFVNSKITEANGHFKLAKPGITQERTITDVTGYTKFGLETEVALPVRDREEDRWILGGDFNIGIAGKNKEIKNENLGNSEKEEYKATASGGFNLNAKRLFDFRPADSVTFKIRPGVKFGYGGAHNAVFDPAKPWNMPDPNAFLFKKTVGSTETTHEDPKQWQAAHQVTSRFELPMGITVKPEKWVCGFVLGATPAVDFAVNVQYTEIASTEAYPQKGLRTVQMLEPKFSEEHVVGLTFDFAGGVHIDVYATGDLTEINKYTAQVFIPLGQPKAKAPKAKKGAEKTEAAKKN